MTTTPETGATTLSARFRDETRQAHESAENSPFMSELLDGSLDLAAWVLLLEQYRYVYAAIESAALRFRADEDEPVLLTTALDRGPSIESDLAALRARTGVAPVGPLPATTDYVEAVVATMDEFGRYIAHHYTRYLGDLSGGQAMRVMLDRHYGLSDDEASFFRFPEIGKLPTFKNEYRAGLDALTLTDDESQDAVDEAGVAFAANEAMFADVRTAHRAHREAVTAGS